MKHIFITGSSRGIGCALAEALLCSPENRVYGISRTYSIQAENYIHLSLDLSRYGASTEVELPVIRPAIS